LAARPLPLALQSRTRTIADRQRGGGTLPIGIGDAPTSTKMPDKYHLD